MNTELLKSEYLILRTLFCPVSNGLITWLEGPLENGTFLTIKQTFFVRFSDPHSKTRPLDNQTRLNHLYTRLVHYSDGYCTWFKSDKLFFRNRCKRRWLRSSTTTSILTSTNGRKKDIIQLTRQADDVT